VDLEWIHVAQNKIQWTDVGNTVKDI